MIVISRPEGVASVCGSVLECRLSWITVLWKELVIVSWTLLVPECESVYIFKTVLAKLSMEVQKADDREPGPPHNHSLHALYIDDTEDEDEFVEDKVPELVLDVLQLGHTQLTEYLLLQPISK